MPVERNEDGSVTIRNSNSVTVVSGMVKISRNNQEESFKCWADRCAGLITACSHTIKETEQYFLAQCDAVPLASDDRRIKSFQLNTVMNCCKDKLEHQAPEFSFGMSDEEIEKWHKEEMAMREEALNSPQERFGLTIRGYYLPRNERNAIFYEQTRKRDEELRARFAQQKNAAAVPEQLQQQDICFFFEEAEGQCQSSGGNELMQQLIAFRGVTEKDIEERNPRFLVYIGALRDMGKLPDFQKG